jgi:DNA-binding NarL/FixJ family response regulator
MTQLREKGDTRTAVSSWVLIVDAHEQYRKSIAASLGRAGYETREAVTGEEALAAADEEQPSLVVLEVSLPDMSGYTVCRRLRESFGDILPIVFVSGERTESHDRMAGLLIGANEYFAKSWAVDEFLFRVQRLVPRVESAPPAGDFVLTNREREILQLLARGLSHKEIAQELCLSPKTVNTYTERLYDKLSVHSKTQAVAVAFRRGLVDVALDAGPAPAAS